MKTEQKRTCSCGRPNAARVEEENPIEKDVRSDVRKIYGQYAKKASRDACCSEDSVTGQAGYTEEQLKSLPESARTVAAGCGNPTALADIKEGETVLDLGSGGGIDVLLAAQKVGFKGKAIGVDMTPEMIDRARENARKSGLKNVEFRLGEIEHLPVADESVDVIVSNCVINLSPEKDQVFKEAYRVLKKGGRMLVSDMMASGLPEEVKRNISLWADCIGGAIDLEEYLNKIMAAGFTQAEVVNKEEYARELVKDMIESTFAGSQDKEQNTKLGELRKLFDKYKDSQKIKIMHAEIHATKT